MMVLTSSSVMVSVSLLMLLMFGLMVVWWSMRSLELVLLGVGFMLMRLVQLGLVGGGDIWTYFLPYLMGLVRLVGCIALCLAFFSLFRVLSFGGY